MRFLDMIGRRRVHTDAIEGSYGDPRATWGDGPDGPPAAAPHRDPAGPPDRAEADRGVPARAIPGADGDAADGADAADDAATVEDGERILSAAMARAQAEGLRAPREPYGFELPRAARAAGGDESGEDALDAFLAEEAAREALMTARARTAMAVREGDASVVSDPAPMPAPTEPDPAPAEPDPAPRAVSAPVRRKIWDLAAAADPEGRDGVPADATPRRQATTCPLGGAPAPVPEAPDAPVDAAPRPRAGRVKTRLLGFHKADALPDPFAGTAPAAAPGQPTFPTGWLIVVDGPGRGAAFELQAGAAKIGRGEDQGVRLDFGDTAISRDTHAAVAYDDEQRRFYLGHGGKANLVRLNDMPVLATEPLADGDRIRIGQTTLRLVALCGPEFGWDDRAPEVRDHAAE